MAAGTVSTTLSEWLVVILIVFSLIVEFILHRIEHWIKTRHHHLGSVVRVLYRELMILGLVSFLFILYETIAKPSGNVILSFEFAHVFIFLLAIFYGLVVLSTMFTSLRLSKRWKKMEQIDLVNYLTLKDQYSNLKQRHDRRSDVPWRFILWWFPNFLSLFKYIQLHEVMAFHDIRFQFIYYRNLPDQFRFSSFLRKIKSSTFIELIESHWSLYVIFLVIVLGDIVRRQITNTSKTETDIVESVFIISAAVLLGFCVQVLAVKVRRVYWQLTKHPRIYYESFEPSAVAREIIVAEQRFEEQRANRRSRSVDKDGSANDTGNDADDEGVEVVRPSVDTPESEMLDPMHPRPLQNVRVFPSVESEMSISNGNPQHTEISFHPPSNQSNLAERNRRRIPASNTSEDLRQMAAAQGVGRHSIGDAPSSSTPSFVMQHRNSIGDRATGPNPAELQSTAERHSLEISRRTVEKVPTVTGSARRGTSIAIAAIEAARKRAAENIDPESLNVFMEAERPHSPRRLPSPKILSQLPSRRTSTDEEALVSGSERIRPSLDDRGNRKRSIELAVSVPRNELAAKLGAKPKHGKAEKEVKVVLTKNEYKNEGLDKQELVGNKNTDDLTESITVSRPTVSNTDASTLTDYQKYQDKGVPRKTRSRHKNLTLLNHLEHQRMAQNTEPTNYPKFVKKVIPRLGRVASPVEKLFWFGSHKFFLWCVEFVMFFSTVLLAAASAGLALLPLSKKPIKAINIAALVLAAINLVFVLVRIAGIIKKYIFILHNASLIPEITAIEAIHTVSQKAETERAERVMDRDDMSNVSGSETEMEEESARERRRNLGRFFRSEVMSGNAPGIVADDDRLSEDHPVQVRWRRRLTMQRRKKRAASRQSEESPLEVVIHTPDQATDRHATKEHTTAEG